jgi:NAD(P)H dehydrogenase (quinone)
MALPRQLQELYFCELRSENYEIYLNMYSNCDKLHPAGHFHLLRSPGGGFHNVDYTEDELLHGFAFITLSSTSCLGWSEGPLQWFRAPSAYQRDRWGLAHEAEGLRLHEQLTGESAYGNAASALADAPGCSSAAERAGKSTLLVLDATGTIGAAIIASLSRCAQNFNIHAGVPDVSRPRCVELVSCDKTRLVQADLHKPETLGPALAGAAVVCIAAPDHAEPTALAIAGIQACKDAGVGHIVVLSVCTVVKPGTIFADQFIPVEEYTKSCGIPSTIVRMTPLLVDDLLARVHKIGRPPLSALTLPLGREMPHNSAAACDLGDAVAAIMMHPQPHANKTLTLTGTPVDTVQLAEALSEARDEDVCCATVNLTAYRAAEIGAGAPERQVDGVIELYKMIAQGEPCLTSAQSDLPAILKRTPSAPDSLLTTVVPDKHVTFWRAFLGPYPHPTALQCHVMRLLESRSEDAAIQNLGDSLEVRQFINFSFGPFSRRVICGAALDGARSQQVSLLGCG